MKLFLQAPHDGIVINRCITVTVESIDDDEVCLSIDAPPEVRVALERRVLEPSTSETGATEIKSGEKPAALASIGA